jgi:hypothetical protein
MKKMEHEICGYWPNASCAGRVVGYTVIESQRDDKPVPVCLHHFHDAQSDNLAYQKGKRAAQVGQTGRSL